MKSLNRAQIDGAESKVITWTAGGNDRKMNGNDYLHQFALPNFFFFVTTAYNILRHRGVPIGKAGLPGPSRPYRHLPLTHLAYCAAGSAVPMRFVVGDGSSHPP